MDDGSAWPGILGLLAALAGLALLVEFGSRLSSSRGRWKLGEAVAKQLALAFKGPDGERMHRIYGSRGDYTIDVELGIARRSVKVRIESATGTRLFPVGFALGHGRHADRPELAGHRVKTGDPVFDEAIIVTGDAAFVMAMMSELRRHKLMLRAEQDALLIADGRIETRSSLDEITPGDLTADLVWLMELCDTFAERRGHISELLAHNALRDGDSDVRKKCVELLERDYKDDPLASSVFHNAANGDASPQVKLSAAQALGADGVEYLVEIVGKKYPAHIQAPALETLLQHAPERAREHLPRALGSDNPRLVAAAAAALFVLKHDDAVAVVMNKINGTKLEVMHHAIATTLAHTELPATEPVLLRLTETESLPVTRRAVKALGRIGSVKAVEPLLALKKGFFSDNELKRLTAEAITQIQGRLGDVDAGRLSMAIKDNEGELALTPDAGGGELTVQESPGQVSLADNGPETG